LLALFGASADGAFAAGARLQPADFLEALWLNNVGKLSLRGNLARAIGKLFSRFVSSLPSVQC
jgi:hypothetical protein